MFEALRRNESRASLDSFSQQWVPGTPLGNVLTQEILGQPRQSSKGVAFGDESSNNCEQRPQTEAVAGKAIRQRPEWVASVGNLLTRLSKETSQFGRTKPRVCNTFNNCFHAACDN